MSKPLIQIIVKGYYHGYDDDFYLECENQEVFEEVRDTLGEFVSDVEESEEEFDDVLDHLEKKVLKRFFQKGLIQWRTSPLSERFVFFQE